MIRAEEISKIGVEEKYVRKEHYNSLKVWWARRPLRAMRAIIINEILRFRNLEDNEISKELINEINPSRELLEDFSTQYNTKELTLLDVFGGGGSIPFESARLGLRTFSSELNPVATLLQQTIFNSLGIKDFGVILKKEGNEIISNVEVKLKHLYVLNEIVPYTIFWSKTMVCPSCKKTTNLSRLKYLKKKATGEITVESSQGNSEEEEKKSFSCTNCHTEIKFKDIKSFCQTNRLGSAPIAICYYDKSNKKQYAVLTEDEKKQLMVTQKNAAKDISEYQHLIPNESVDSKNGVINPTLYDLKQHKDFFNDSQLLVLIVLIDELIKSYPKLKLKYGAHISQQLILANTALIEFLVDWNSTGTMWIAQNEQTGRSLAGPGVGMKWDYIEINPFFKKGSNLRSKIKRVSDTYSAVQSTRIDISIFSGSSTSLSIPSETIDLIVTDPPYFDSIDYTGLSEFFRPWFEVLIKNTYNKEIILKNDTAKEAIVQLSKTKSGDLHRGEEHYYVLMRDIFIEGKRVLKHEGKLVFVYGHKTIDGWNIIARSIKDANLYIKKIYPLDMERPARPRAMAHQALNGVIVFELVKDTIISSNTETLFSGINEVNSNYTPLYLAGLSCQLYTNSGKTFDDCYREIKEYYRQLSHNDIGKYSLTSDIATAYLSLLNNDTEPPKQSLLEIIKKYNLSLANNSPRPLNEIDISLIDKNDPFYKLVSIYLTFSNNSSTKINLDKSMLEYAFYFFGKLSDIDLNTVANRTFVKEKKIFRLIISKISLV